MMACQRCFSACCTCCAMDFLAARSADEDSYPRLRAVVEPRILIDDYLLRTTAFPSLSFVWALLRSSPTPSSSSSPSSPSPSSSPRLRPHPTLSHQHLRPLLLLLLFLHHPPHGPRRHRRCRRHRRHRHRRTYHRHLHRRRRVSVVVIVILISRVVVVVFICIIVISVLFHDRVCAGATAAAAAATAICAVYLPPTGEANGFVADPPRFASPGWLVAMTRFMLLQQNRPPFPGASNCQSAPPDSGAAQPAAAAARPGVEADAAHQPVGPGMPTRGLAGQHEPSSSSSS